MRTGRKLNRLAPPVVLGTLAGLVLFLAMTAVAFANPSGTILRVSTNGSYSRVSGSVTATSADGCQHRPANPTFDEAVAYACHWVAFLTLEPTGKACSSGGSQFGQTLWTSADNYVWNGAEHTGITSETGAFKAQVKKIPHRKINYKKGRVCLTVSEFEENTISGMNFGHNFLVDSTKLVFHTKKDVKA